MWGAVISTMSRSPYSKVERSEGGKEEPGKEEKRSENRKGGMTEEGHQAS